MRMNTANPASAEADLVVSDDGRELSGMINGVKGAHVAKIWERGGVEFDDPAAGAGAKGAAMIRGMVKERVRRMNESLQALDQTVTHTMPARSTARYALALTLCLKS